MKPETIFSDIVANEEELTAMLGTPSELVKRKVIHHLDEHCRHVISQSPFLTIATSDHKGNCDVSPRGDSKGFVHVVNEDWLVIPERPGNKRTDSMRNILSNPKAGLLFIIPGLEETLRINGKAIVVKDKELLEKMAVNGRSPLLGIAVKAEECFIHCAKAFKRSRLFEPSSWPEKDALPSAAKILFHHANLPGASQKTIEEDLAESYTKRLY